MKRWIKEHDDRWSFILPYIVLSVTLSIALSLFWLLAVILVYGAIEWTRLAPLRGPRRLLGCLARTQLDWALLLAAVCMEVYLETAAGLAGAGQFARGLGRILSRLPGWQSVLRAVLLSSDDALQLVRLKKETGAGDESWRVQRLPLGLAATAILLWVAAPWLLPIQAADVWAISVAAFRPFP